MPKKPLVQAQSLRIIAGEWRSRKVHFPSVESLRPTGDRVRETLFNWLSSYLDQSHCLDLYAGSGILGFEALSRGAKKVSFVEKNHKAYKALEASVQNLETDKAQLFNCSAEQYLANQLDPNISIIFLDPPYQAYSALELLSLIAQQVSWPCKIFYEHDQALNEQDLPENWLIQKEKKAGRVYFYLLEIEA